MRGNNTENESLMRICLHQFLARAAHSKRLTKNRTPSLAMRSVCESPRRKNAKPGASARPVGEVKISSPTMRRMNTSCPMVPNKVCLSRT